MHFDICNKSDFNHRTDQTRVQMMMQFIHSNYNKEINLGDISQTVLIGKSTVLRLFHRYIHISPIAYLIQYRLKKAARMISSTEKKISVIAKETGFRSDGYFCRKFKEFYGVSPQTYRKEPSKKGNANIF